MRDDRVTHLATVNAIAHIYRHRPLFVFRTQQAAVVYIFGKLVWKSKHWHVDHPQSFRQAYKRYHRDVQHILRDPTPSELYGMLPAFHPLERRDGMKLTVGDVQDFATAAWKAKQVSEVIKYVMQAERQYILEDTTVQRRAERRKEEAKKVVTGLFSRSSFNKDR